MRHSFRLAAIAALLAAAPSVRASWPQDFTSVTVASGWNQPVGMTFDAQGRMFVWEKSGHVWSVVNGVKSSQPLLDIEEEVGDWRDHGLLGFALDPHFATNGFVYLFYVVDFHFLKYFGTPQYDPGTDEYYRDTIARITRFTLDPTTLAEVPGSRFVLLGESMSTGVPICNQSHGVGTLVFGSDGTLLVSCGESSSYEQVDTGGPALGSSHTALADGIIQPKEDVGAFRAQLVDSLSGKVLRLDPATGDGVRSNPFFDASAPRAPRSRVWALGLRNPFRMARQAGTGSSDPAAGDPGKLWIGDVGWDDWEELDVCDGPGRNFGWPLYEGMQPSTLYSAQTTVNADAPNPLGACPQPFFAFRDLLVQDTLAVPSWPNPCDASQQIPRSLHRFVHTRPLVDWYQAASGPARTRTFSGTTATTALIGASGSPLGGPQFGGHASIGGAWYAGTDFPAQYRDSYYFADYVEGWIRRVVLDASGTPVSIEPFATATDAGNVVALATDPVGGGLYFIHYATAGTSTIRKVVYAPIPIPIAEADANPHYGALPLSVRFSSAGSVDPQGQALTYQWDFGDGSSSTLPDPVHVYDGTNDVTAQASIVARVLELVPPHPTGTGAQDPNVIRDGDRPPVGSASPLRQYDTFHNGAQGNFDWIGYAFPTPRTFHALVFQEGMEFPDGGWFDQLDVQVGDGTTWTSVSGLVATPPYPGHDGVSFETYRFDFAPTAGTHIRIAGRPGGTAKFVSVGELRVIADDPGLMRPARIDVQLTVTSSLGVSSTTQTLVALNDTPPVVHVTNPVSGSLYSLAGPTTIPLAATVFDAEQGPLGLFCSWQTILHHNEHTHPEPVDSSCGSTTILSPIGCDGQIYYYEIDFTVVDAIGLSASDAVFLYPACTAETVCAGDGSGAPCPCGNNGAAGAGCENSFTTGGARLVASGSARTGADQLALDVTGLPPTTLALYFQGTQLLASGQGTPFGDGLRCVAGTVVRLGTRAATAGACSYGASVSSAGQVPAEGGVRYYQVWYRNSASFCTAAASNLSNAVRVTWIP